MVFVSGAPGFFIMNSLFRQLKKKNKQEEDEEIKMKERKEEFTIQPIKFDENVKELVYDPENGVVRYSYDLSVRYSTREDIVDIKVLVWFRSYNAVEDPELFKHERELIGKLVIEGIKSRLHSSIARHVGKILSISWSNEVKEESILLLVFRDITGVKPSQEYAVSWNKAVYEDEAKTIIIEVNLVE